MDPEILFQISKWQVKVKSENDSHELNLRKNSGEMATVVRQKAEAALIKEFGESPMLLSGRLTETQLLNIMNGGDPERPVNRDILKKFKNRFSTIN